MEKIKKGVANLSEGGSVLNLAAEIFIDARDVVKRPAPLNTTPRFISRACISWVELSVAEGTAGRLYSESFLGKQLWHGPGRPGIISDAGN